MDADRNNTGFETQLTVVTARAGRYHFHSHLALRRSSWNSHNPAIAFSKSTFQIFSGTHNGSNPQTPQSVQCILASIIFPLSYLPLMLEKAH